MVTRTISGILGGLVVVFVLIFNNSLPFLLNLVISIICAFATYEIFSVMRLDKMLKVNIPSIVFSMLLPLLGNGVWWQGAWVLYTFFMFGVILLTEKKKEERNEENKKGFFSKMKDAVGDMKDAVEDWLDEEY